MAGERVEDPRLWRYTASEAASRWVKERGFVLAVESSLPELEKRHGITVLGAATDAEAEAAGECLGLRPGVRLVKDRAREARTR